MATVPKQATLASERAFLQCIDGYFPNVHPKLALGRGDDCCLTVASPGFLISSDLFLEGVHFRRSYFSPSDIGWKALAVNLSDIAAMGGRPIGFSLGLMAPAGLEAAFWHELFSGMAALAAIWDVALAGGDLSCAAQLGLAITVWGEPGPEGRVLRRGGCEAGDALFVVSGEPLGIGLARIGFLALETSGAAAAAHYPAAVEAHLRPRPLIEAGQMLAGSPAVRSLLDVSDGLARDIPRLLGLELPGAALVSGRAPQGGSGFGELGVELEIAPETLHPEVLAYAARQGLDPVELAVRGGEDYALCGAAALGEPFERLCAQLPELRVLGRVTDRPGLRVNGKPFEVSGFDHFAGWEG